MGDTKSIGVAFRDQDLEGSTISSSTVDGSTVGASGGTAGFFGTTPTTQPADASQAALTLTTATTAGIGFSTVTAFDAFTAQLENIRASLVALGLLKGSA